MSLLVLHAGPVGAATGGIGQVAQRMAAWDLPGIEQRLLVTTRGRGVRDDVAPWARGARTVLAARRRPAVVHLHLSQGGSFVREAALVAPARAAGVPVAVHLHGSDFVGFSRRRPRLCRAVLRRARTVFCLTGATEARVRELVGPSSGVRVVLVHNGDDPPPGPLLPAEPVVVFAGVVGHRKGVDVLVEAWRRLDPPEPWRLEVHGPPDARSEPVADPGLPRVSFHGATPHPALMERLRTTSVAVLPSRAEAFPAFLVEAMARGAVPVASDVGDCRRLVGDAGLVVPPGDPAALAAALGELVAASPMVWTSRRTHACTRISTHFSSLGLQRLFEEEWHRCLTSSPHET